MSPLDYPQISKLESKTTEPSCTQQTPRKRPRSPSPTSSPVPLPGAYISLDPSEIEDYLMNDATAIYNNLKHDMDDLRYTGPKTDKDIRHIEDALAESRADYLTLIGEGAPATTRVSSYAGQYEELVMWFTDFWYSNMGGKEPFPVLFKLEKWTGELGDWKTSPNAGTQEAFRRIWIQRQNATSQPDRGDQKPRTHS